jgi:hypothetical protein
LKFPIYYYKKNQTFLHSDASWFLKSTSFKRQRAKVITRDEIMSFLVPNSKLRKGMIVLNSMLTLDATAPNHMFGLDASAPNPTLRARCDSVQLHVGPGRVRAQPHVGLGRVHAQPHVGWTWPSLIILGCSRELDLFSPRLRAWIEPNVPQIGCVTEGSLYTEPPIP